MKHIKRKFSVQLAGKAETLSKKEGAEFIRLEDMQENKVIKDNTLIYLQLTDDTQVLSFPYNTDGRKFYIPDVDPVLIYFNVAQFNFNELEKSRKELLESLHYKEGSEKGDYMHKLYSFTGMSSTYVVFLFMAIESFMNKIIPPNAVFKRPMKKEIKVYDAPRIQQMEFKEKLTEVLPYLFKKSFVTDCPDDYQHITNLKLLRDEIVHSKSNYTNQSPYSALFKKILDFDYSPTIYAARNLINYYHPDLVEECNCGRDF